MRKLFQRSRQFWVYAILFGSLVIVAIGWAYHHWYWPSPQGRVARQNANKLRITALPLDDTPFSAGGERIRATTPLGSTLLLEVSGHDPGSFSEERHCFFEIDTAKNTIRPSSLTEWKAATGAIIDYLQIGLSLGERPKNFALQKVLPGWKPGDSVGRYVMDDVLSPTGDYIALLSADGRFHPPVRRMFWGREAYADGQHYLEVRSIKGGGVIGLPVAVPLPKKVYTQVLWTADEQFMVLRYRDSGTHYVIVVPTGVPKEPSLQKSGADAKVAGYGVFQLDLWWEEWRGAKEFQIRNESPKSPVMLFNMPVLRTNTPDGFLVYKYDPFERTLLQVNDDQWQNATGPLHNANELFPEPDETLREAHRKGGQQRTPTDWALLKKEEEEKYRQTMYLKRVSPTGIIVRGRSFTSNEERVAVQSFDREDSDFFYHEIFETNRGKRIGDAVKVPKTVGWGPTWTPDGRYILYRNQESRLLTIIHTDLAPQ